MGGAIFNNGSFRALTNFCGGNYWQPFQGGQVINQQRPQMQNIVQSRGGDVIQQGVDPSQFFGAMSQNSLPQIDVRSSSRILGVFESLAQSIGGLINTFGSWLGVSVGSSSGIVNSSGLGGSIVQDIANKNPSAPTPAAQDDKGGFWSIIQSVGEKILSKVPFANLIQSGIEILTGKGSGILGSIGNTVSKFLGKIF